MRREKIVHLCDRAAGGIGVILQPVPEIGPARCQPGKIEGVIGAGIDLEPDRSALVRLQRQPLLAIRRGCPVILVADQDERRHYEPTPRGAAPRIVGDRNLESQIIGQLVDLDVMLGNEP